MDQVGFNGVSPKDLYNKVQGNKTEFVKQYQEATKDQDTYTAEKIFRYMASMEKDDTPGLTQEEYKQGLKEKSDLVSIKIDKIYSQYVAKEDWVDFGKMSQKEKLAYLENKIPHEPGLETEAHIMASLVLSNLNRLEAEYDYITEEQMRLETEESLNKSEKTEAEKQDIEENIKDFNGFG